MDNKPTEQDLIKQQEITIAFHQEYKKLVEKYNRDFAANLRIINVEPVEKKEEVKVEDVV